MASDELKEMLVDYYDGDVKDWKRLGKKAYGPDKVVVRTFENTETGMKVWTFGNADDECLHPAGDHYYYLAIGNNEWYPDQKAIVASFNPKSYWESDEALWDQHCGFQIKTIYNLPDWIQLDEACENTFIVNIPKDKTIDDVKAAFESSGLLFNQAFHDFMSKWR